MKLSFQKVPTLKKIQIHCFQSAPVDLEKLNNQKYVTVFLTIATETDGLQAGSCHTIDKLAK